MSRSLSAWRDFIRANTEITAPPLTPEVPLYLASDRLDLWRMGEAELDRIGLPAPFWAFAWAGGQALARTVLYTPALVRGKSVLDFGAGSALVGIAAAKAGATVTACEIDPVCEAAISLNAEHNQVALTCLIEDVVGAPGRWDVILAADVCYEDASAKRITGWLKSEAARGVTVLVGDPGRTYFPQSEFEQIARYAVPTDSRVEDTDLRNARVWQFRA